MDLVCKFGGSSLSSASQFEKVKKIVTSNESRRVIVVSALGKRTKSDNKLTDLFYSVYENMSQSNYYENLWSEITSRFIAVKKELNLSYDITYELDKLKHGLAARSLTVDYLVSRGEYLTAKLMSEYLDYTFYDAKDLIIFGEEGDVNLGESYKKIAQLPKDEKIIIPGFYGADEHGFIKLFSRGGSDITGAIVASGLGATKYENFTDVCGVLMADPRIVNSPKPIEVLTYDEMSAIANMGAEVLHRKSVYPVKLAKIPIHIKNTNDPDAFGTLVVSEYNEAYGLTGFFGKKDYTFLTLYKERASFEIGFMRKTFELFEKYKINIEQSLTCIDQVGVLISSVDLKYTKDALFDDLTRILGVKIVEIKEDFSLLAIFGRGVLNEPAFIESIFKTLKNAGISTFLTQTSPKGLSITIGVSNDDYNLAINVLYEHLVETNSEKEWHYETARIN